MDKTEELRQKLEVLLPRNKAGNNMLRAIIRTAKQQAKQEVFDDFEKHFEDEHSGEIAYDEFEDLRKRHLSTSQSEGTELSYNKKQNINEELI